MALANSIGAIGAVTDVLVQRLKERTSPPLDVTVGRAEPDGPPPGARLNLFLYEVQFDASLKNVSLDEGQRPPLWMVLKYLMTAFDDDGKSTETTRAYENLGNGLRALQQLNFLSLDGLTSPGAIDSLSDNPEDLKITFDEAPTDLLSKVMQGSDEKYRLSVAFQIRPVMIAAGELPSYSLLVGVNYSTRPPTTIGEKGIQIPVIPSLGSTITDVSPASFERGETVTIKGTDLHLGNLSIMFGPIELPVTMQQPNELQFVVRPEIATPAAISAGSYPLTVSQLLPTGRRRASNALIGNLRPVVTNIALAAPATAVGTPPPPVGWMFGDIDVTGELLGRDAVDDFYLALYKDGRTFAMLDTQDDQSAPIGSQTQRRFQMNQADAVPPGTYLGIYRVNGQQAAQGFSIELVP
jgi:hypothetical protein